MYKYLTLAVIALTFVACTSTSKTGKLAKKKEPAYLNIFIQDTLAVLDSLKIYAWQSIQAKTYKTIPVEKTSTGLKATFSLDSIETGMYFVGVNLNDIKELLLSPNEAVTLSNSKLNFAEANVTKSKLNQSYTDVHELLRKRSASFSELVSEYNSSKKDQVRRIELLQRIKELDATRKNYHDSLKLSEPMLARFAAFHTYPSYQNNKKGKEREGQYYARAFFNAVDFKDTVYARLPIFYENVKLYAASITRSGLSRVEQQFHLDSMLNLIGKQNPNYKSALMGVTLGMMGKKNHLFVPYAKQYLTQFRGEEPVIDGFFDKEVAKLKGKVTIGQPAPNLVGTNPEGKKIELKDFKGKYVLIDFWASWCGPCRRDNPHVVQLYEQYKSKGLEILGVSLDSKKGSWVKAIEKDKLTWPQISDLKGWKSELAKLYGVRSIPHTVLVKPNGDIEVLRLRGPALDARLKLIFRN